MYEFITRTRNIATNNDVSGRLYVIVIETVRQTDEMLNARRKTEISLRSVNKFFEGLEYLAPLTLFGWFWIKITKITFNFVKQSYNVVDFAF